jgi:hypothetical protein
MHLYSKNGVIHFQTGVQQHELSQNAVAPRRCARHAPRSTPAASPSAPAPRPRFHAARAAPSPGACAPRRLFFSPRHASLAARAVRARQADRQSVRGPSHRPMSPPYYSRISAVFGSSWARVRTLFKVAHSPHAYAKQPSFLPLHRVRH